MPKKGDKLYRVLGGELDTATFLEEGFVSSERIITAYTVLDSDGHRCRCLDSVYCTTQQEAWEKYVAGLREGIPYHEKEIAKAQQELSDLNKVIAAAERELAKLLQPV